MTVSKEIIAAKVEEMAKVSKEKAALDIRYKELEAFFLKLGGDKLRDSKRRTCSFEDNDGHDVTYTEAKTVKIISPAVLKRLMGDAFGDFVKETVDPKYTFKSKELEHTFVSVYSADIAVPEHKLNDEQADIVIRQLQANLRAITPEVKAYISNAQISKIFGLMYEFAKLSPSAVTVKERLCGIIKKELGITVNPKYDIFKGFSERQGAELIDTIKRYVRAEKRRKERTDGKIKT